MYKREIELTAVQYGRLLSDAMVRQCSLSTVLQLAIDTYLGNAQPPAYPTHHKYPMEEIERVMAREGVTGEDFNVVVQCIKDRGMLRKSI